MDEELGLFIVCDGVSGNVSGNFASELCARTIREIVSTHQVLLMKYKADQSHENRTQVITLIQHAIQTASSKIYDFTKVDVLKKGICTTVEVLLLIPDYAILGHVGDSRIYLQRGSQVHQLTEDHKVSQELKKKGIWTAEDAKSNPHAEVLTRVVGLQEYANPDLLEIELMPGDLFLLCTDGLTDYLHLQEILKQNHSELSRLPKELVELAKKKGGADNITTVVVQLETKPEASAALDAMKKAEILGKVPVFQYLNYLEITKVLSVAEVKSFAKGVLLMQEGAHESQMHILISGAVEILKSSVVVAKREKGEVIGEMGFFDQAPRSASVRAVSQTDVLSISRKDLLPLLRREGQIAVKFLWALNQQLNQRLRSSTEDLAGLRATVDHSKYLEGSGHALQIIPFTLDET